MIAPNSPGRGFLQSLDLHHVCEATRHWGCTLRPDRDIVNTPQITADCFTSAERASQIILHRLASTPGPAQCPGAPSLLLDASWYPHRPFAPPHDWPQGSASSRPQPASGTPSWHQVARPECATKPAISSLAATEPLAVPVLRVAPQVVKSCRMRAVEAISFP